MKKGSAFSDWSSMKGTARLLGTTLSWFTFFIWLMGSGGALSGDANHAATQITVNYDISLAGFHFGDVRLIITLRNADYQMRGDGQ
ncbi:MAG: hypothetical protein C5B58_04285, partial [Acidobacteria bacterium]